MGDTHVYFIKPVAATPRSESGELKNAQKFSSGSVSKKIQNVK